MKRVVLLAVTAVALGGCAESTSIRTSPPDAKIYVNDKFIGVSPVEYTVSRSEFRENIPVRIERDGYYPVNGTLQTHIATGRVVGGLFGLGIPFLFRGPTAFIDEHDFALQSVVPIAAPPPRAPLVQRLPPDGGTTQPEAAEDAGQKLRRLKDMYDRGIITEDEYRKTRARIVGDL